MEEISFYLTAEPGPVGRAKMQQTRASLVQLAKKVQRLEQAVNQFNRTQRVLSLPLKPVINLRRVVEGALATVSNELKRSY